MARMPAADCTFISSLLGRLLVFFLCCLTLLCSTNDVVRRVEHALSGLFAHEAVLVLCVVLQITWKENMEETWRQQKRKFRE